MPQTARALVDGDCYHARSRGNERARVLHDADDDYAFVKLLREACARVPLRLVGHCLMSHYFHLVLWP